MITMERSNNILIYKISLDKVSLIIILINIKGSSYGDDNTKGEQNVKNHVCHIKNNIARFT